MSNKRIGDMTEEEFASLIQRQSKSCPFGLTESETEALRDLAKTWTTIKHSTITAIVVAVVGALATIIGFGIKAFISTNK
jgi:hypothetical protein